MNDLSAVIVSAQLVAGHDGSAELAVRLAHPQGGEETIALDGELAMELMARRGIDDLDGLSGQRWLTFLEGL